MVLAFAGGGGSLLVGAGWALENLLPLPVRVRLRLDEKAQEGGSESGGGEVGGWVSIAAGGTRGISSRIPNPKPETPNPKPQH